MNGWLRAGAVGVALACQYGPVLAQDGVIVYRLGRDTVAIERFVRTHQRFSGETVTRTGPNVVLTRYEIALDKNGWPTSALVRRGRPDGSALPGAPSEYRFTFGADSATRVQVWPDSTSSRTYRAPRAFPALPVFAYAPLELLRGTGKGGAPDSALSLGLQGNPGYLAFETAGGDTLRLRGGPYAMRLRFGRDGRVELVDGTFTTNKSMGTRSDGTPDLVAIGRRMAPTGVLSPRITAQASILEAPIMINYSSPSVRGRTVWGGTLVPYDSVWRLGANEATHLATSRRIQLGDLVVEPGLYTLWVQPTRGPSLIVNRQVGQWGTQYDRAQDLGRVTMTLTPTPSFVEALEIRIRALGRGRGAIEILWGDQMAAVEFAVQANR